MSSVRNCFSQVGGLEVIGLEDSMNADIEDSENSPMAFLSQK